MQYGHLQISKTENVAIVYGWQWEYYQTEIHGFSLTSKQLLFSFNMSENVHLSVGRYDRFAVSTRDGIEFRNVKTGEVIADPVRQSLLLCKYSFLLADTDLMYFYNPSRDDKTCIVFEILKF